MNITNDIYYIGVNDHDVDLFEGQYIVPDGMAYNSYVIMDAQDNGRRYMGIWGGGANSAIVDNCVLTSKFNEFYHRNKLRVYDGNGSETGKYGYSVGTDDIGIVFGLSYPGQIYNCYFEKVDISFKGTINNLRGLRFAALNCSNIENVSLTNANFLIEKISYMEMKWKAFRDVFPEEFPKRRQTKSLMI